MNYWSADTKLGGKTKRKVGNNTYLVRLGPEEIGLKLHYTFIVRFFLNGDVILNSGGWRTVTTKARINEFAEGVSVYQKDWLWFAVVNKIVLPFHDGMIYNIETGHKGANQ